MSRTRGPVARLAVGAIALATAVAGALAPTAGASPVNVALATNPGGNTPTIELSHVNAGSAEILNDGASGNGSARGTNWNAWPENSGTTVTVSWPFYVDVTSTTFHAWTDCPTTSDCSGGVFIPSDVEVQTWDADAEEWVAVSLTGDAPAMPEGVDGVRDYPISHEFDEVRTSSVRFTFPGQERPVGATEVEVLGENTDLPTTEPDPIDPGHPGAFIDHEQVELRTVPGELPEFPEHVWVLYEATAERADAGLPPLVNDLEVAWDVAAVAAEDYDEAGDAFSVTGTVEGSTVTAEVAVHESLAAEVTDIDPASTLTTAGLAPVFPDTVTVTYADGSRASGVPAEWAEVAAADYAEVDGFGLVDATVEGVMREELGAFFVVAPSPADAAPVLLLDFAEDSLAPSGWHTTAPRVRVQADRGVTESEIVGLEYCLTDCGDGGAGWADYAFPVFIEAQGEVTFRARATDDGGRVGEAEVTMRIDTSAPVTTATETVEGRDAVIELSASDADGSGVTRTVWSSGPSSNPNSSENVMWGTYDPAERIQLQLSTSRQTYVHFRSEDAAGHVEEVRTLEFDPLDDVEPTPDPSEDPTPDPSEEPSPDPSEEPTEGPSEEPTAEPSPSPTTPVVDVYSTPGFHVVNGRQWYTTCEPYSQTIRCTTQIWATQVAGVDGTFANRTGWYFNNLTYLPHMSRAQWAGNPLGVTGTFNSDGRQWRTECDTAATGRGGCRSFVEADVVHATTAADGTRQFRQEREWVFNNIVRFG
ncbi:Ig-like domain-containing protein [Tessaracoccus terricola]